MTNTFNTINNRLTVRSAVFRDGSGNRCLSCCERRKPEYFQLDSGDTWVVNLAGEIWRLPSHKHWQEEHDTATAGTEPQWEKKWTCRRYVPWMFALNHSPIVHGFGGLTVQGYADDVPWGKPYHGDFIGFEDDPGHAVVFHKGRLIYCGKYDSTPKAITSVGFLNNDYAVYPPRWGFLPTYQRDSETGQLIIDQTGEWFAYDQSNIGVDWTQCDQYDADLPHGGLQQGQWCHFPTNNYLEGRFKGVWQHSEENLKTGTGFDPYITNNHWLIEDYYGEDKRTGYYLWTLRDRESYDMDSAEQGWVNGTTCNAEDLSKVCVPMVTVCEVDGQIFPCDTPPENPDPNKVWVKECHIFYCGSDMKFSTGFHMEYAMLAEYRQ